MKSKRREDFFANTSFWNQPIGENAQVDSRSSKWIEMLKQEPTKNNFSPSYSQYTVPIYDIDSTTPVVNFKFHYLTSIEKSNWVVAKERFGHGPGFNPVPIPSDAIPESSGG